MKTKRGSCLILAVLLCAYAEGQFAPAPSGPQSKPLQLPVSGRTGAGSVTTVLSPAGGQPNSVSVINPSIQIQGAYEGSTPNGTAGSQTLQLTLEDAVQRGLRYNLGTVGAGNASQAARAERLATLAQLLPDINGDLRETVQQTDLVAEGLRISVPLPGFHFPSIVGPFNYFDLRAAVNENVSLTGMHNFRASQSLTRSSELSIKDSRDLVTLAVAGSYLQLIASAARIQTAQSQIDAAQAVYQQAVDRNKSGVIARIDVTRSQVELQTEQQRLTSLNNQFAKEKLALARLIGMPMAQAFALADTIAYRERPAPDVASMIQLALATRPDVQAAEAQVKAAEQVHAAAIAEHLPALGVSGDYGVIGVNPAQSHGTFSVTGAVQFPIFRSGRISADIQQADAALAQRRAEYEDTRARAEQDVRNAALDLNAAAEQVKVAESNRTLAGDTLQEARDRFRSGVSDTVEVVQAQEFVATAEQDYINSTFAYDLAEIGMARATGQAAQIVPRLLGRQ